MVYTSEKLQALIEQYIKFAQLQGVNIEQVWLHGAYADGMPMRWDFIDLAIMSPDFTGGTMFSVLEGLELAVKMLPDSVPIRVSAFQSGDYTAETTDIRKNGRLVWEASKSLKLV